MPTSMEDLTISADFPSKAGAKLICTTSMVSDGGGSATADCVVFRENEDLSLTKVCEFTKTTLRVVGEEQDGFEDKTSPFHRKHSYKIRWDIDLDYISPKSIKVSISSSLI
jgi:hypothetical protein